MVSRQQAGIGEFSISIGSGSKAGEITGLHLEPLDDYVFVALPSAAANDGRAFGRVINFVRRYEGGDASNKRHGSHDLVFPIHPSSYYRKVKLRDLSRGIVLSK